MSDIEIFDADEFENIILMIEDGIATITISREKKLNALDNDTLEELAQAIEGCELDENVGVILITGAGARAFVAGAEIDMLAEQGVLDGRENSQLGQIVFLTIEQCEKPVIAAVNGFALGGGCELALACDIRYASENAVFGLPEVSLGLLPGYGGTQRLPRLIGSGLALEMILTGDMVDAQEALRIGLVNKVLPADELLAHARERAKTILKRSPVAVRFAKESVRRGASMELQDGLNLESDLFGMISSTEDMREGTKAFLEKRKPDFPGC